MTMHVLAVIDWGYNSLLMFYGWTGNFPSVRYTWAFHVDINLIINYLAVVISLMVALVAIRSLHFTRKAYEANIRSNRRIIVRDCMISAMSNVTSHVHDGGDYQGKGMCISYPIVDKVGSDLGIISKWNQVPPKSVDSGGNHHFVFTYRIFFGNEDDLNRILKEDDWSNTKKSVTIHLIRTGDGSYRLSDRVIMSSYDDFISEGRTVFLDNRKFDYVVMILDSIMMWSYEDLMKYQNALNEYDGE